MIFTLEIEIKKAAVLNLIIYQQTSTDYGETLERFYPAYINAISIGKKSMRRILDFRRSRNQRRGSEFFSSEVDFMRWFTVAFLTNGVFKSDTWRNQTDNPLCCESTCLTTEAYTHHMA